MRASTDASEQRVFGDETEDRKQLGELHGSLRNGGGGKEMGRSLWRGEEPRPRKNENGVFYLKRRKERSWSEGEWKQKMVE